MTFNNNITGSDENQFMTRDIDHSQNKSEFDCEANPDYTYPLSNEAPAKSPPDWTFSPPTAWPESPYVESPLSSASAEIYPDSTWNPFDQSFATIQSSIDQGTFPASAGNSYLGTSHGAYQQAYNNSNPRARIPSYVSLSAVNDASMDGGCYEDDDETPRPGDYQMASSPCLSQSQQSRQPAWGNSRPPRRSSTSSKSSSTAVASSRRRKSIGMESSTAFKLSIEPTHRLRSTQSSGARTIPSNLHLSTGKSPRTNHNHVEKQYRNRLNGQFETLLQILPRDDLENTSEKRVSKAEVLVLAKRHIEQLEREKAKLEMDNEDLEQKLEELKKRWVGMGGICMP